MKRHMPFTAKGAPLSHQCPAAAHPDEVVQRVPPKRPGPIVVFSAILPGACGGDK